MRHGSTARTARFGFLTHGSLSTVHWSAVLAGVVCSLAVHIVLGLFVGALGAAAAAIRSEPLGWIAGLFGLLTPFAATFAGASVAVRSLGRLDLGSTYLHGVLVWAIGLVCGALFLAGATGAAASTASDHVTLYTNDYGGLGSLAASGSARGLALAGLASLIGLCGGIVGAAVGRRASVGRWLEEDVSRGIGAEHVGAADPLEGGAYGRTPPRIDEDLPPRHH